MSREHSGKYLRRFRLGYTSLLSITGASLSLVFLLLITLQVYHSTSTLVLNEINSKNINYLYQSKQKLDNNLMQIENIVQSLVNNKSFTGMLQKYRTGKSGDKSTSWQEIMSLLETKRNFNDYISGIVLFIDQQMVYTGIGESSEVFSFYDIHLDDLKNSLRGCVPIETLDGMVLYGPNSTSDVQILPDYLKDRFFYYAPLYEGEAEIASILVIVDSLIFDRLYDNDSNLLIVDKGFNAIWTQLDDKGFEAALSNPEKTLNTRSKYEGITFIYYQSAWALYKNFLSLGLFLFFLFIVTSIFSVIFSRIISKDINKGIRELIDMIDRYDFNLEQPKNKLWKSKKIKRISMRENIFLYLGGVVLIPSLILLTTLSVYSNYIVHGYINERESSTFLLTAQNVDFFFENKRKAVQNIIYDEALQSFLVNEENFDISSEDVLLMLDERLALTEGWDKVYIMDAQENLVLSNVTTLTETTGLDNSILELKANGNTYLWKSEKSEQFNLSYITLTARIRDLDTMDILGYLYIQISEQQAENVYKSINEDYSGIFILDGEGMVVSNSAKNKIGLSLESFDYSEGPCFKYSITGLQWQFVQYFDMAEYKEITSSIFSTAMYLLIILICATTVLSFLFAHWLTGYFRKFNRIIADTSLEHIGIVFPEDVGIHEVDKLGRSFNELIIRIETLVDQLVISAHRQSELDGERKEAEMIALQAQINPHFLYNTFESIRWLIKSDDKCTALRMLENLSSFLRYCACSEELVVTLDEEIANVRIYTNIIKLRYKDRISFMWSIDEETKKNKIIRHTIQPIIENAVMHGFKSSDIELRVRITSSIKHNDVWLDISDDGLGIDSDTLQKINKDMTQARGGIGLRNVYSRIHNYFGEPYGLRISSEPGHGTTVRIIIPKKN